MTETTAAPPRRLVGLVDCSAFYCSCERVFDPRLEGVPVAVLSNNDGCVIARSQGVKDAGVAMGEPFFKARARLREIGAAVLSSNYTLYGDMSRRVMSTLETFTPDVAEYSIDEAFLSVPTPLGSPEEVRQRVEALAREVRARVLMWTGIPVRVSFAETKTLAKAASEYAKVLLGRGEAPCVCLYGHPERERWLSEMDVADVWGVGRRWGQALRGLGASTAATLAAMPDALIRKRFNVVLLRTVHELRGLPCLPLDDAPLTRQTLVKSRSFGEPVTDLTSLSQAVSTHAARAAEKLRREGLVAGRVSAFITTKRYGEGPHRSGGGETALAVQTADTGALIAAARACLRRGYAARDRAGRPYRYRKAGVMLTEIRTAGTEQQALLPIGRQQSGADRERQAALMEALDAANERFGKRAVVFGSMGAPEMLRRTREESGAPGWEMRRQRMSPRYTTRWGELMVVRALAPFVTPDEEAAS
ncbi:MAG TPA: Y-family DNA polymerase [Bacteroidetes bacterium]|nr:Y-family DNA polymerase [Bacteroidota bacterium]